MNSVVAKSRVTGSRLEVVPSVSRIDYRMNNAVLRLSDVWGTSAVPCVPSRHRLGLRALATVARRLASSRYAANDLSRPVHCTFYR